MKKILTICAISAAMMFGAAHAAGKKATAVTQFQASGSVVTQGTIANSIANASNVGITVVGLTNGGFRVVISATQTSTGKTVSVPATAVLSGGKVTVTFADGSSTTFDV